MTAPNPNPGPTPLGQLLVADLRDCTGDLDTPEDVARLAIELAELAELTVLHQHTHRFEPHGLSSVLVLAESHLSIHTWPEHRFATLDLFSCRADLPTDRVLEHLTERLAPGQIESKLVPRGAPPAQPPSSQMNPTSW